MSYNEQEKITVNNEGMKERHFCNEYGEAEIHKKNIEKYIEKKMMIFRNKREMNSSEESKLKNIIKLGFILNQQKHMKEYQRVCKSISFTKEKKSVFVEK